MKKLLSTQYKEWAFNTAMFLIRVSAGLLIMSYGYDKLVHFAEKKNTFMNFLGIGSTLSLLLVIFAEFFCSLFLIIGLFSRLVAIPLVIVMVVVLFKSTHGDIFGKGEMPTLFLASFLTILLCGPGKASVDGFMGK